MNKKAYCYIDDTIWVLRELTHTMPKSLFDVPLLRVLKTAHDKYGTKMQLNLFYRTDYFYGSDEFSLADVTDAYKDEWMACSDWLKMAFHAKEEFPDYPHINATYKDVYSVFKDIEREVFRFAGEKSFTYAICPHWLPVSKAGVKALYDCGVRLMDIDVGKSWEYNGDMSSLPYGHAARLLSNRQHETRVYNRSEGKDESISNSLCGYNHVEDYRDLFTLNTVFDKETGMLFKKYCSAMVLNHTDFNDIEKELAPLMGKEFLGICNHEQYFYKDYFAYQPDYEDKIYKMSKILADNGYEFIFAEDLIR